MMTQRSTFEPDPRSLKIPALMERATSAIASSRVMSWRRGREHNKMNVGFTLARQDGRTVHAIAAGVERERTSL